MARWGEGDPRWIVEERPDATNVNNWHWTEKNATSWSKDRFRHLFTNLKIDGNNIEVLIEAVEKCAGEATANNRKGRLIFFYEWDLILKWKGCFTGSNSVVHTGKISIPNLSEENELKDIEVTITIDESNDESEKIKQFMYCNGREKIRNILALYITELKEEYSKNLILPKKDDLLKKIDENGSDIKRYISAELSALKTSSTSGCRLDVRTLCIEEEFHCSAIELYNSLTKASMVTAFTRGPARVEAFPGGEFSLYGGCVHGNFEELVPEKKLILRWRLKSWPPEHYSNVSIEIQETQNCTHLKLKQTGVPKNEYEAMRSNWYRYYWHSIKQTFGFGIPLTDVL